MIKKEKNNRVINCVYKIFMMLFVMMFFCRCKSIDSYYFRSVGFQTNNSDEVEILEKINFFGEDRYITPEGRRSKISYKRKGYYVRDSKGIKELRFFEPGKPYLFLPLGQTNFWIALLIQEQKEFQLEYAPTLKTVRAAILFSLENGVQKEFNLTDQSVYFTRGTETIWFVDKETRQVSKISPQNEKFPRAIPGSESEQSAFFLARERGVTFIDSLQKNNIFSLNEEFSCAQAKESYSVILEDDQKILSYNLVKKADLSFSHRLTIHMKNAACQSDTIDVSGEIVLTHLARIQNGHIWYFELEKEEYSQNTKLKNLPLPDSF